MGKKQDKERKNKDSISRNSSNLSSAEVWKMVERNLGKKLIPLKIEDLK